MLKENLAMLRNIHGYSQEQIAEKIGISRQAYAKWESGATIPDIEKCAALAEVYGTTIDSLIRTEKVEGIGVLPPAPVGKNFWGSVTVGDRGQIVIPKGARDKFGIKGGDRLLVGSDEVGIALFPVDAFKEIFEKGLEMISGQIDQEK
jgi:AbrB family looped-hinge helix DNA binding protein